MSAATARREARRLAICLVLVLCLGLGYTAMALDMDWRTSSGQIGPGFFPALLGTAIVVCAAAALTRVLVRLRASTPPSDEEAVTPGDAVTAAEGSGVPESPWVRTTVVLVVLMAAFVTFLLPLGAVIGSALFLLATTQILNPNGRVTNIVLSLSLPIGLYLLLETLLRAGLPPGPIPV